MAASPMEDIKLAVQDAAAASASPMRAIKSAGGAPARKPRPEPTHPPVATMVVEAIKKLKNRRGSSLLAIKRYISASYTVDVKRLSSNIKCFLKSAAASGRLVRVTGQGASGSFTLPEAAIKEKAEEKPKTPVAASAGVRTSQLGSRRKVSIFRFRFFYLSFFGTKVHEIVNVCMTFRS